MLNMKRWRSVPFSLLYFNDIYIRTMRLRTASRIKHRRGTKPRYGGVEYPWSCPGVQRRHGYCKGTKLEMGKPNYSYIASLFLFFFPPSLPSFRLSFLPPSLPNFLISLSFPFFFFVFFFLSYFYPLNGSSLFSVMMKGNGEGSSSSLHPG